VAAVILFLAVRLALSKSTVVSGESYWEEPGSLPLNAYVCHQLEPAVDAFDLGDYRDSLRLIETLKPTGPTFRYQTIYLRGLCLQRLGRFEEAANLYVCLTEQSSNDHLGGRAAIGANLCRRHESNLPDFLLLFPSHYPSADGI
jgi:hypothetical protein